ncbi:MAG: HEPN domain-containing protein [Candidatus Nanohalobium sp.]
MTADEWLEKAEQDFEAAEAMKQSGFYSQAAFLYQQAAEKGLKALLVAEEKGVKQTHDCFVLAREANAEEDVKESANSLSPYYFRTRYPDTGLLDLTEDEISKVEEDAEVILEWVREKL